MLIYEVGQRNYGREVQCVQFTLGYRKRDEQFGSGCLASYRPRKSAKLIVNFPFYLSSYALELDTYTYLDFIADVAEGKRHAS